MSDEELNNLIKNLENVNTINVYQYTNQNKLYSVDDTFKNMLNIYGVNFFNELISKIDNCNSVKNLSMSSSLTLPLETYYKFPNLERIDLGKRILSLDELTELIKHCPKIMKISVYDATKDLFDAYPNIKQEISLYGTNYEIKSDNPLFGFNNNSFNIKKNVNITLKDGVNITEENIAEFAKYSKMIQKLNIDYDDIDKAVEIKNLFDKYGIKISLINIELNNKNYDSINKLDKLKSNNTCVQIVNDGEYTSIDDFKTMRATIEYYKKLITDYKLSPVETILFAYDIIKSWNYHESEKNLMESRHIPGIVKTGNIVCIGYANFLGQLLSELGIKATNVSTFAAQNKYAAGSENYINPSKTNHARNLIRIDDDKYGIHGIFAADATWDHTKVGLQDYSHFLIPAKHFHEVFPNDSYPALFSRYLGLIKEGEDTSHDYEYGKELKGLLNDNEESLNDSYYLVDDITEDVFKNILYNVRISEGFTDDNVDEEIASVLDDKFHKNNVEEKDIA